MLYSKNLTLMDRKCIMLVTIKISYIKSIFADRIRIQAKQSRIAEEKKRLLSMKFIKNNNLNIKGEYSERTR